MRRTVFRRAAVVRTVAAAASVASLTLALGACGADKGAESPAKGAGASAGASAKGEEPAAKTLTAAELEKAALAQGDVTTHQVVNGTKADEVAPGAVKTDKPECKPLLDAASAVPVGKPVAKVLRKAVQKPEKMRVDPTASAEDKAKAGLDALSQPVTADVLASYDGKGAQEGYAAYAKAAEACAGGFGGEQAGEKLAFTKVVPDTVTGGDEAQGWTIAMKADGTEVLTKLAVVRKGNTLATFYTISLGGTVKEQPASLIAAQVKKLG